jgi:DMSO reductase anchor subunit
MSAVTAAWPIELLPPVAQRLWGWPAVLNFVCGGLGAGLYLASAAAGRPGGARWLGPALVLIGFLAVAAEAGRPLRGARVLARVRTSWMSRELWLGAAFALGAAVELPVLAVPAAALLALAQGAILRRARGVPAWDARLLPLLFLSSALVSGTGLLLLLDAAAGRTPGDRAFAAALVLLVAHMALWQRYLASRALVFRQATRPLREGVTPALTVGAGYLAPALLIAPALAWPALAGPAAGAAGVAMIAGQVAAKAALILRAGGLRPITLPRLAARRSPP